ncbi:hypothetical protein EB796_005806 [Bugula neritina]|uniref:Uncharacterized protein n=1 Tax=Bugula neritina TaxID=10212 RepID=A0A7J7KE41_BUGNE|nr:hypothetical protein EB796_005806 [Bugula neritina]
MMSPASFLTPQQDYSVGNSLSQSILHFNCFSHQKSDVKYKLTQFLCGLGFRVYMTLGCCFICHKNQAHMRGGLTVSLPLLGLERLLFLVNVSYIPAMLICWFRLQTLADVVFV